jgi:hypothetical protein
LPDALGLFDFDSRACRQRTFPEDVEEAALFYDPHQIDGVAFFRPERIPDFCLQASSMMYRHLCTENLI